MSMLLLSFDGSSNDIYVELGVDVRDSYHVTSIIIKFKPLFNKNIDVSFLIEK